MLFRSVTTEVATLKQALSEAKKRAATERTKREKFEAQVMSAFWEWGSPDLPACGLQRGSGRGPARPVFISSSSRPSQGAKPRGADDRKLP